MAKTKKSDPATSIDVAYQSGPPEINFFGRRWIKDRQQPVTSAEWEGMQSRPDFAGFDFQEMKG
ncbi:MAG: hypothetical protein LLG15_11220 [Betaproteobacteria bacterium]|nr:hypothetical protein [Betaproteobacteria bacterium]